MRKERARLKARARATARMEERTDVLGGGGGGGGHQRGNRAGWLVGAGAGAERCAYVMLPTSTDQQTNRR